jgi:hypothetical protein
MTTDRQYTGSVYTGVVGAETEHGACRDSIMSIARRPGDSPIHFVRATKGFEARQGHFDYWLTKTDHDFMLLLDSDMVFPADTLEKLRSHGKPYLSGYYLFRSTPLRPIWFKPFSGSWPFEPYSSDPERGRLHELGASGWGCILVHREVAEAVRPLLKGEAFVIEDDMDVYPYDLHRVITSIKRLKQVARAKPRPEITQAAVEVIANDLANEFRPLRGLKDNVGSDLRFPWFARLAGYPLYGDPDVRCGHMLHYPVNPDDYSGQEPAYYEEREQFHTTLVAGERERVNTALRQLGVVQ